MVGAISGTTLRQADKVTERRIWAETHQHVHVIGQACLFQDSNLCHRARVLQRGLYMSRIAFGNASDALPGVPGDVRIERERVMRHDLSRISRLRAVARGRSKTRDSSEIIKTQGSRHGTKTPGFRPGLESALTLCALPHDIRSFAGP